MTTDFRPPREGRPQFRALADRLKEAGGEVELVLGGSARAQRVKLPPLLSRLLMASLQELGEGHTVALVSTVEELTPAQAARILGVSRPHLVNTLLKSGQLPYRMVGRHHRIAMNDLLTYQDTLSKRQQAADELARLSEKLGLYQEAWGQEAEGERPSGPGRR